MNIQDIEKASERLKTVLRETPLGYSRTFSEMSGNEIYLKYENLQKTGSFKIRGAYNKIAELADAGKTKNIVACSAGNHAQGVAFAASQLKMNAVIVMPKTTPIAKIKATQDYGAQVILHGNCYDDAYQKALEIQKELDAELIHPFDDTCVISGQGTVGQEILTCLPNVEVVFVPAGGGGLLAGVAFYLKNIDPNIKVIGVQAEGAPAIKRSFDEKKQVTLTSVSTIADGIAVKRSGKITQKIIDEYVDDIVTVSDTEIGAAILNLLERCKVVVEPAGAVSVAAVLADKANLKNKRCVCVLSGGNIDVSFIHRLIEIGLVTRNRKLKFRTVMKDVPGTLEEFARIMSDNYANIVMVQYDRMSADLDPQEVILHIACEVADKEHGEKVVESLEHQGYKVFIE